MPETRPFCPYCGESMRWSELRRHEQTQHQDLLVAMSQPGSGSLIPRICPICGASYPAFELPAHMKFAHPRIAAYARFVVEVTYGVCFLWMFGFLAFVVLWEDVHLISYDGAVAGTAGLTVLLALVAVWMRVFALRHLLRLRSVWQPPKTQSL